MSDRYIFEIELADSGDEFSETFNPKNETEVEQLEDYIKEIFQDYNLNPLTVKLKRVIVDIGH